MHGRGHAWQEGMCGGGCEWQGVGVDAMHALPADIMAMAFLLECILV